MDKDLLGYLMAAFPDESESLRQPETRDYLTIRGYRVAYEAGADPDILELLSTLQPGARRAPANLPLRG
ncbi:MAG: hypothetical protein R3F27_08155 [Gammaproteobacteria bacterium]